MKYFFRVEVDNSKDLKYIPYELETKNRLELEYFDYFCINYGDYIKLKSRIAKDNNLSSNLLGKIYIECDKGKEELEAYSYTPVIGNPYLEKIFENNGKTFYHLKQNKNRLDISKESPVFKEMKDYLFKNMNNKDFFENLYKSNNRFSKLIKKYLVALNAPVEENSDVSSLEYKKNEVIDALSDYRNYRSFAKARYKYENEIKQYDKVTLTKEDAKVKYESSYEGPEYNKEKEILLYNQDNEEFLEEEEFDQMVGEGNAIIRKY